MVPVLFVSVALASEASFHAAGYGSTDFAYTPAAAWINKLPDLPLPYRVGPLPMSHGGGAAAVHLAPGFGF